MLHSEVPIAMHRMPWHSTSNRTGTFGSQDGPKASPAQAVCSFAKEEVPLTNGVLPSRDAPSDQSLQLQWPEAGVSPGCGLVNVGNSCFLNSTLQCLAHLPPLAALSQAHAHKARCKWDTATAGGKCVACLLETRVRRCLAAATTSPDRPNGLVNNMTSRISKTLSPGRQEDAHEFLRMLLDAAERDALHSLRGPKPLKGRLEPQTLVQQLFGGVLTSDVTCGSCGEVSSTRDQLLDLSLELQQCSSIVAALHRFTAAEQLSGTNAYKCGACNRKVTATKQIRILEAPTVLVLHLKRFSGHIGAKITRHIAFQERLNLGPFCSPSSPELRASPAAGPPVTPCETSGQAAIGPQVPSPSRPMIGPQAFPPGYSAADSSQAKPSKNEAISGAAVKRTTTTAAVAPAATTAATDDEASSPEYRLYGMLVHQGLTAQSGHYYSFVQAPEGQWNRMNDATCYTVSAAKVMAEAAYMLFYVRCAPRHYVSLATQARVAERVKFQKLGTPDPATRASQAGAGGAITNGHRGAKRSASSRWDSHAGITAAANDILDPAPFGPMPPPADRGFSMATPYPWAASAAAEEVATEDSAVKRQRLSVHPGAAGSEGEHNSMLASSSDHEADRQPVPAKAPSCLQQSPQLSLQQQPGEQQQQQQQAVGQQARSQHSREQQRQWKKHGLQIKGGFTPGKPLQQADESGRQDIPPVQNSGVTPEARPATGAAGPPERPPPPWALRSTHHSSTPAVAAVLGGDAAHAQIGATASGAGDYSPELLARLTHAEAVGGGRGEMPEDQCSLTELSALGTSHQLAVISSVAESAAQLQSHQTMNEGPLMSVPDVLDSRSDHDAPHAVLSPQQKEPWKQAGREAEGQRGRELDGPPPPPPPAAPTLEDRAMAMFPMDCSLAEAYQLADQAVRDSSWPTKVRNYIRQHRQKRGGNCVSGKAAMLADLRTQMGSALASEVHSVVKSAVAATYSQL